MHLAQYMEHRLNVANTKYSFGFRKRRRISWLAEWLLVFQKSLCSMELVIQLSTTEPGLNGKLHLSENFCDIVSTERKLLYNLAYF
jgi:hypothetical protein